MLNTDLAISSKCLPSLSIVSRSTLVLARRVVAMVILSYLRQCIIGESPSTSRPALHWPDLQ